jgi:hypothetical protein
VERVFSSDLLNFDPASKVGTFPFGRSEHCTVVVLLYIAL